MFAGIALVIVGLVVLGWVMLSKRKNKHHAHHHRQDLNIQVDLTQAKQFDSDEVLGLKPSTSVAVKPTVSLHEVRQAAPKQAPVKKEQAELSEPQPPKKNIPIIALYLVARRHPFAGYELLQTLLSAGLRFGKMKIFHRHENKNGYGKVLFSLASAIPPGTFDIPKIGGYECPGLCMFLECSADIDNLAAFDLMLETAKHLSDELDAVMIDQDKKPFSMDKAADHRRTIRQFETSLHTRDLFEPANE